MSCGIEWHILFIKIQVYDARTDSICKKYGILKMNNLKEEESR